MTTPATISAVETSVVVSASQEHAFLVFTKGIGSWWPPEHHIFARRVSRDGLRAVRQRCRLRPGHRRDRVPLGSGARLRSATSLRLTWNINLQWQLESDPEKVSEIEVTFTAESPTTTRVELTHRHLERHGSGWEQMCDGVDSPDGWPRGLARFAEQAKASRSAWVRT
jgi:hypothetical protein